jgi:hypothetical protein
VQYTELLLVSVRKDLLIFLWFMKRSSYAGYTEYRTRKHLILCGY